MLLETYNYIWSIMAGLHPSFTIGPSLKGESLPMCMITHNTKENMDHKTAILSNLLSSINEENIWVRYGGMQLSH